MNTHTGNGRISGRLVLISAVICAAGLIGITTASATTAKTVVSSHGSSVGQIIVAGSNGHTLYGYVNDSRGKSACYNACSKQFVPLWAKGRLVSAKGSHVNGSKLGKIRRKNGSYQVTYFDQPLYLYAKEKGPHELKAHDKQRPAGWYAILTLGTPAPPQGYCLSVTARIATSNGSVHVADVKPGMSVWSTDLAGHRIREKVVRVHHTAVPSDHLMVRLRLADGRHLLVSLGHPLPNGQPVETLKVGQQFEGTRVVSNTRVQYGKPYTYDLLPAGPTHTYFADGILLGSTLAPPPHAASAAVLAHPF